MMTVLFRHQPWERGTSFEATDGYVDWNMWQRRQSPYDELEPGQLVVLVASGGPREGMITWEVEVTAVAKGWYRSHPHAWEIMRGELREGIQKIQLTRRHFLTAPYTAGKPESGWLLAWTHSPVCRIMRPRPPDLRFRQNGWAILDRLPYRK